jgi:acetylglutamate synthase
MRLKHTNKIEIFENIQQQQQQKGHYHLIFVKHEKLKDIVFSFCNL